MEQAEFTRLHESCTASLKLWTVEATRTCEMLGACLSQPLTVEQRARLGEQRTRENEAHAVHMGHRQRLFEIARLGFQDYELLYGMLPGERF